MGRGPSVFASMVACLLIVVAGCVAPDDELDARPVEGAETIAHDAGVIRGLVTDDSLVPIVGAGAILDGQLTAVTDEKGIFTFTFREPGQHDIVVIAPGYQEKQVAADVELGRVTELRVTLILLATAEAYHEVFHQTGMIGCGVSGGAPSPVMTQQFAACYLFTVAGFGEYDQALLDWGDIHLAPDVTGFWAETSWVSNQALSNRLNVLWFIFPEGSDPVSGGKVIEQPGPSPVRQRLPFSVFGDSGYNDPTDKICADFVCGIGSGHYSWANNSTVDAVVVVQQHYEEFLTVFHKGELPVDYTALPDA